MLRVIFPPNEMKKKSLHQRLREPLQVKTIQLAGGREGNLQTVRYMKKEARKASKDIDLRMLAMEIVRRAGCPSHDEVCEAIAIGKWVQRNVRYVKDPNGVEWLMHPTTLLDQISAGRGQGDCDDMAFLTAALLLAIGHSPAFKMVRWTRKNGFFDHIYVVDRARAASGESVLVVIDAILKDRPIGTEVPSQSSETVWV